MDQIIRQNLVNVKQFPIEQCETPLYFYDFDKIEYQMNCIANSLPENFKIHYTLKANSNLAICSHLASLGASADISSIGELLVAIKAGFSPQNILFTGPGKTKQELAFALQQGVSLIVIESLNEAYRLNYLAAEYGIKQNILIRINPLYRTQNSCEIRQKNSSCSAKIDSSSSIQLISQSASKFGVDEEIALEIISRITSLENITLKGIHIFTESNLLDYQQLVASCQNTINIANRLKEKGYPISIVDFGGGIGVPYNNIDAEFDVKEFGQQMQLISDDNPYQYNYIFELGRYLVCESGSYITEIVDIKESQGKKFLILDGGVHQLFRTSAMMEASKFMDILGKERVTTERVTLAGKLPTPLDIISEDVEVPCNVEIGDRIVIYNCGAYGFNHSLTNFALHNYPAEIAYHKGEVKVIRISGKAEDFLLNQQVFPS
ncbi:MAG: hypothetical protein F6K42_01345 [Leptolyngbya sp. SIO1D8]|nr:hypothetical protein [Leptolyngbya sp. SIO1D8]